MDRAKIQAMIDELTSMLGEPDVAEGGENSEAPAQDGQQVEQETTEVPVDESGATDEGHIDPQTNGAPVEDDVTPKVDAEFTAPADGVETVGTQNDNGTNYDAMFASYEKRLSDQAVEIDKLKVFCAEIGTRLELVQEITDKVTTVDHDSLLTDSIKLLV